MKLQDYLNEAGEKPKDFASRAGISQPYISRLLSGDRFPRPEMIGRIDAATGGKVTALDWFATRESSPSEAAA